MPSSLTAPEDYVNWMNSNRGFNPRAQKASDFLANCVFKDILSISPKLRLHYDSLQIKYKLNKPVSTRVYSRDIDLVLFDPNIIGPLLQTRITVENKTIMTAHGKARYNRQGDLIASFNHVHNHNRFAIATATMIINISSEYENPDRIPTKTPRRHLSSEYIRNTMGLYEFILRESVDDPNDQPEAISIILVDYDGINQARLVTEYPALSDDSPYHYNNFCHRISQLYDERF